MLQADERWWRRRPRFQRNPIPLRVNATGRFPLENYWLKKASNQPTFIAFLNSKFTSFSDVFWLPDATAFWFFRLQRRRRTFYRVSYTSLFAFSYFFTWLWKPLSSVDFISRDSLMPKNPLHRAILKLVTQEISHWVKIATPSINPYAESVTRHELLYLR